MGKYVYNNKEIKKAIIHKYTDYLDWSCIGYSERPKYINRAIDLYKEIEDNWSNSETSMENFMRRQIVTFIDYEDDGYGNPVFTPEYTTTDNPYILYFPQLDTSNVTNMRYCFKGCTNLTTIPELDTSKVTDMTGCFEGCKSLRRIEGLDIRLVDNFTVTSSSIEYMLLKGIGRHKSQLIDLRYARNWGLGSDEDFQSVIDSLYTYSYSSTGGCDVLLNSNLEEKMRYTVIPSLGDSLENIVESYRNFRIDYYDV